MSRWTSAVSMPVERVCYPSSATPSSPFPESVLEHREWDPDDLGELLQRCNPVTFDGMDMVGMQMCQHSLRVGIEFNEQVGPGGAALLQPLRVRLDCFAGEGGQFGGFSIVGDSRECQRAGGADIVHMTPHSAVLLDNGH